MWTSTRKAKLGVAIYNFDGKVNYGVALSVGDTVCIKEECCGWYRGYALKNKVVKGIFPVGYIHLRQCRVDIEGPDETLAAIEDPVVGEVCYVLREWNIIWKQLFMLRQVSTFNVIQDVMHELTGYRRELISGTLTQEQIIELKSKITSKIDWGNKLLNLDLVPRANNEQVDVEKISPVELFYIHHRSAAMSKGATIRGSIREQQRKQDIVLWQLVFVLTNCTGATGQEIEIHFFLYDGKLMKPFSEKFIVRVTRQGILARPDKQHNCAAVFSDLGEKDSSREAYVVALVYRLGSLKEGETGKIPSMFYRRPYGCGVNRINDLFDSCNDGFAEKEFVMKIYLCNESEFPHMTENLIKKQASIGTKNLAGSFNVFFTLKWLCGDLNKVRETDPTLFKGIAVAVKIGFPDVIMPDTLRNDLFLTLVRGEFEKGSKTASKNVEVRITAIDKFGKELQDCICPGVGDMRVTEYNSSVFYHSNSPRWNETVRLAVPIEGFHCSHVRLEFRHCSRKDKTEKKLMGFAFLKLAAEDSTALSDGQHELFLYKCDDLRKLKTSDIPYTSLPSSPADIIPNKSHPSISHPHCHRIDKELICVDTVLCSTKLTQNADLLGLLKWKTQPDKIYQNLEKLMKSDGDDTVKFLQDILDALFNMISTESADAFRSQLIFKALVHIFNLMEDGRFENFKSVLDAYIETSFSGPLIYRELLSCLREILDHLMSTTDAPSVQEQFQKCFKVLEYISKCIVESQLLYMRAYGHKNAEEFTCLVSDVFEMKNRVLAINNDVISATQGALLENLPGMLLQLSRLQPMLDLSQTIMNLISAIPKNAHKDLDHLKLKFMKQIAKSVFFKTFESKSKLLPLYVSQLKHHLINRVEIKLCINILAEVLASLHTDHQLSVSLKPNVQVLLDGVLEVLMQVLMLQCKSNSTLTSRVVSCLASIFKLMDEQSYRQLILRFADKPPLRDFLERMLKLLQELVEKEVYPKDWFVMKMATNHLILHVVQFLSQTICEQYLKASDFDSALWKMYFHLAVSFLVQPCLQLEQFSPAKRQKIKEIYGDMRVRMGYEILSMWQNLGDRKINFLPSMVGPFLEVTLIPETELRRATLPMFFDMMECEQEKYGSFQQVENELIDKLDIMLNADKGDYEYKQLFNTILLAKVQTVSEWQENGTAFIHSVANLLERLLDYRNILESEDNREKRMTCTMNLLNFYKGEANRKDMYIRYIYKLFDLHLACGNHTEAAFTLQLHAELLGWTDQLLPEERMFSFQMEWQRKELIYLKIIEEFDKGKSWEYGLPLCETLAEVYKEKIMYEKLSNILQTQAEFYQKILRQHRPEPEYFRVGFFGQGFPLFLRNKEFVYRGNDYEKLLSFQQRLQSEFLGASILGSISPPSVSVRMSDGQCIQICSVKPLSDVDPCFLAQCVPERVRNFYKVNLVQRFQMDRPFHRGEKDDTNEFKTLYIERTIMKTCSKLPGLLRWFEIEGNEIIELCPVEVAIYTMECMNQELRSLVMQYANDSSISVNPLTMRLSGVIDAAVQGGGMKYQEAFFTDNFLSQSTENTVHVRELKLLFTEQLQIVESALYLHRKLVPPNMLPLHRRFEEKFVEMKQGIQKPESPRMRWLDIELGEMSKHSSSSSLSSHSTPLGSNRSSGVYCESFADTSSVVSDFPILEDQKSMYSRGEKSHLSTVSWDQLSSTSSLVSPEKSKGQRPDSGSVQGRASPSSSSRWQSSLSTSSGELTIADSSSSSSASSSSGKGHRRYTLKLFTDTNIHSKLVSGNTSAVRDKTPLTPVVLPGHSNAKKYEHESSAPVLPPKRSQSNVSSPSSLAAIAAILTPRSQEAKPDKQKEPLPPIPARNSSAHLTNRSATFRERKKLSDNSD